MPRQWTQRWTSDRTLNSLARTLLQTVDDTTLMQETTHSIYSGESQQTIEHFHPYGFTAVPQPGSQSGGAESIIAFLSAGREHGVAIVTGDRRHRLLKLQPGEVALHDDQTQQRHIARKGIFDSVPSGMSHNTRVMRQQDSVKGQQNSGAAASGTGGAANQNGQQAWQPKTPYAYHSIDKDARTVQHPGKIAHQVTDTNDQSTVVHESWLDQIKGIFHGVQKGLHSITISPQGGIVHAVQNALHSLTLLDGIKLNSGTAIQQIAPLINLKGASSVTGTLGVSQLLSALGGASIGSGSFKVGIDGNLSASSLTPDIGSAAIGDILYRDVTHWKVLGPGTAGQILTTEGVGFAPVWSAAGAGLTAIADGAVISNISGSTAVPGGNQLSAVIDHDFGSTEGQILYRGVSAWLALAPGTAGQVLTTGGAGAIPAWAAAGSSLIFPSGGDDTSIIQAAINANETVLLGAGTFKITALTLGNFTKLSGLGQNETIITRFSGSSVMITSATGSLVGLNALDKCVLSDFRIDGGSVGTGINILNHAALVMNRVIASNCAVGFDLFQAQFCSFYSIMADACGVGLYLHSGSTGGGNSNSFYDLRCVYGSVGVIVSGVGGPSFPQHSNYFRNPSLLVNSVCQFAVFGASASNLSDVTIDGSANEASGGGPSTYTYDSLVVKQASIYCSSASMNFMNSNLGEPADPCIILNSGSRLSVSNLRGYAHTFGQLVQTDSSSICSLSGDCMFIGCIDGCTSLRGSLWTEVGIAAPPATFLAGTIENDITNPSSTGTLTDATGTTSHTTGVDTFFGPYTQVNYAAGAGSTGSNRANFAVPCTAGRLVVAVNVMSNVDALIGFVIAGDPFGKTFDLWAGVWTRIVYVTDMASTGTQAFKIFPWNAGGPVLQFCQFHARSGPITDQIRADVNSIAAGAYNPVPAAVAPNYLGQFTVASLPASPPTWSTATATNGLKIGETTGTGTGVPVYYSGATQGWRTYSTDQPVAT